MKMESDPSLRVSVTGIDGSGKTSAVRSVSENLGQEIDLLSITDKFSSFSDGVQFTRYHGIQRIMNSFLKKADSTGIPGVAQIAYASAVLLKNNIIEPNLIARFKPEIILRDRDPLIDTAVYSVYYSPMLRKRTMKSRINFIRRMTGGVLPDELFYLSVPVQTAMERIHTRSIENGENKFMHESEKHLERIANEYNDALEEVGNLGVKVHNIDAQLNGPAAVENIIFNAVHSSRRSHIHARQSQIPYRFTEAA